MQFLEPKTLTLTQQFPSLNISVSTSWPPDWIPRYVFITHWAYTLNGTGCIDMCGFSDAFQMSWGPSISPRNCPLLVLRLQPGNMEKYFMAALNLNWSRCISEIFRPFHRTPGVCCIKRSVCKRIILYNSPLFSTLKAWYEIWKHKQFEIN